MKQAAEAAGKTKPTILRAIQRGRLGATQDSDGKWWIEPGELERVFPVAARTDTRSATIQFSSATTELLRCILDELRQMNAKLEETMPVSITPVEASAGAVGSAENGPMTSETAPAPLADDTPEGPAQQTPNYDMATGIEAGLPVGVAGSQLGEVQQAAEAMKQQKLNAAREVFDRGYIALNEGRYVDAVAYFKEAAGLLPDGCPAPMAECLEGLAEAFYYVGCERGEIDAFKQSSENWRLAHAIRFRSNDRAQ